MRAVAVLRAHTFLTWRRAALLGAIALAVACGGSSTTTPTTTTGTVTETLNGLMAPQGVATRTFTANQPGTVTVQLVKTDPSLTLGLGIGIHSATGADCNFSQTLNTVPGGSPQLSVTVDPGEYCAGAYDAGTVGPSGVIVTVTVTHP
jgi:ABC-type glycerol-3-phosphate transport system substrate-binding protein